MWELFKSIFPEAEVSLEKYGNRLKRRTNHPVPEQRITRKDLELFSHMQANCNYCEWYLSPGPDLFLGGWRKIKHQIYANYRANECSNAQDSLQACRNPEAALDLSYYVQWTKGAMASLTHLTPEQALCSCLQPDQNFGHALIALLVARELRQDLYLLVPYIRPSLRQAVEHEPAFHFHLPAHIPVKAWAGFTDAEWFQLARKAETQYRQACEWKEYALRYQSDAVDVGFN